MTNTTPAPAIVLGEEWEALEESLRDTLDLDAQAKMLDEFFARRILVEPAFETFDRSLQRGIETNGAATVDSMAEAAGVSRRQVDRLFARYLGIPPKTLARVLRFQTTLRALMSDPGCTLADVATAAGYFDQAHFVKDFKRMTGGVPRGYRGYFPPQGPTDFAPNVVVFLQDQRAVGGVGPSLELGQPGELEREQT